MKILNVITQKGGTGKSETVKNLAYGLSNKGLKTLVVDLDPQANTSATILKLHKSISMINLDEMINVFENKQNQSQEPNGLEGIEVLHSYMNKQINGYDVSDVLLDPTLMEKAVKKTVYQNLDILPASSKLIETDMKLKTNCMKSDTRLDIALQKVANKYDVCIIDNSPFINAITINGVTACKNEGDLIIIPIKIDSGSLEGVDVTLQQMLEILSYSSFLSFDFKLLFTMRNRTVVENKVENTMRKLFPERCFNSVIRYQAKPIITASNERQVLLEGNCKSGVAQDYISLVDEIYNTFWYIDILSINLLRTGSKVIVF